MQLIVEYEDEIKKAQLLAI